LSLYWASSAVAGDVVSSTNWQALLTLRAAIISGQSGIAYNSGDGGITLGEGKWSFQVSANLQNNETNFNIIRMRLRTAASTTVAMGRARQGAGMTTANITLFYAFEVAAGAQEILTVQTDTESITQMRLQSYSVMVLPIS
jgi:hypothetical protein